jgi:D-alanyl-D-alanine carboxypeptidase (penicillin-binding protein 5/6)
MRPPAGDPGSAGVRRRTQPLPGGPDGHIVTAVNDARHLRSRRWRPSVPLGIVGALLLALALIGGAQALRSVPAPQAVDELTTTLGHVPAPAGGGIAWPSAVASAVAVPGELAVPAHGARRAVPIASITKLMTALVVLHDHPLALDQQGPEIVVDAAAVAQYHADAANHDSVVAVTVGEHLSEYQAIEAMLVPSADDIAQLAARWDAGSEAAFVNEMNALAGQWGLTHSHFAGPSGVNPASVSTADEVLHLGERAMDNPVIRSVVALGSVDLPGLSAPAYNTDFVLGRDGVIGIKTGSDTAAGGCFVFAADITVARRTVVAFGAVLGQESRSSILEAALHDSVSMISGLRRLLGGVTLVHPGETVGSLAGPDGTKVPLVAGGIVTAVAAPGTSVPVRLVGRRLPGDRAVAAGALVGVLSLYVDGAVRSAPVVASRALRPPSLVWRLLRV